MKVIKGFEIIEIMINKFLFEKAFVLIITVIKVIKVIKNAVKNTVNMKIKTAVTSSINDRVIKINESGLIVTNR